jgi:hypothetical protein
MLSLSSFPGRRMDPSALLKGSLLRILKEKFGNPLKKTFDSFPSTGVSQKILLSIVWALGSHSSEVSQLALFALRLYSTLFLVGAWTIDLADSQCRAQGVSQNLDLNVSNILNHHFLYLYTNAVQKQCSQSQVTVQVHSLRVLIMLLTLLQAEDLVKYLPKVLSPSHTLSLPSLSLASVSRFSSPWIPP